MFRLLFDWKYRLDWLKFRFNPFWYGVLRMPYGSGYVDHDRQTNINL